MNAAGEDILEEDIERVKWEMEVPNVKTADDVGKISTQGGLWFQYTKSARISFDLNAQFPHRTGVERAHQVCTLPLVMRMRKVRTARRLKWIRKM